MQFKSRHRISLRGGLLGALAITCTGLAHGVDLSPEQEQLLRTQVDEQTRRLETLRQQMVEADAKLAEIKRVLGIDALSKTRGGTAPADRVNGGQSFELAQANPAAPAGAALPAVVSARDNRAPEVAPIFEQPGVLTPRGKFVLEPGLQYSYSSSSRVSIVGYTIIPALTIGLIDVREVKRNTTTASLTGRWGVTNRFELEAKLPYVYRSDDVLERPQNVGSASDDLFSSSGKGIGDFEMTGRYQFNDGGVDRPYYIGTLRLKSRTGKDPFEVLTDTTSSPNANGLQRELPVGSGFYTLQPGITVLYPTDPAVFFGSLSYQYNFERSGVTMNTTGGKIRLGDVKPGDAWGFNFGMGLALNERSSFSIGYDHSSVGKTRINGSTVVNAVRTQLGTLLLGYSHRLNATSSLNLSVGVGATRDAPDLTLSMRVPVTF
jgi:hypothetical protein